MRKTYVCVDHLLMTLILTYIIKVMVLNSDLQKILVVARYLLKSY